MHTRTWVYASSNIAQVWMYHVWYHSIRHGRTPVEVCQLSLQGIEKLKTWIDSLVFSKSIFSYLEAPCNLKPQYYLFFYFLSLFLIHCVIFSMSIHLQMGLIVCGFWRITDTAWSHVSLLDTCHTTQHSLNTCWTSIHVLTFYYIILFTLWDTMGKLFGQVKETLWVKM